MNLDWIWFQAQIVYILHDSQVNQGDYLGRLPSGVSTSTEKQILQVDWLASTQFEVSGCVRSFLDWYTRQPEVYSVAVADILNNHLRVHTIIECSLLDSNYYIQNTKNQSQLATIRYTVATNLLYPACIAFV
jgi:hypothetical protein